MSRGNHQCTKDGVLGRGREGECALYEGRVFVQARRPGAWVLRFLIFLSPRCCERVFAEKRSCRVFGDQCAVSGA